MTKLCLAVLIIFLTMLECTEIDFQGIVSKNESQMWLKNQTERKSPSNLYCSICCMSISSKTVGKKCGIHTMCIYKKTGTGPACKGYIEVAFTDDEKTAIVDAHNTLRNKVATGLENRGSSGPQPPASNMRLIEWDLELATVAERWAAQCRFAQDVCRDLERYPVGQNIAKGNFATNNDLSFIKSWYENVQYFDKSDVESYRVYDGKPYKSQYTQFIWGDTYQIGCARAVFQHIKGPKTAYREHFICNYGPSGNIPGQPVYRIGQPCTLCPEGTSCSTEYPALCASEMSLEISYDEKKKTTKPVENMTSKSINLSIVYIVSPFIFIIIR